ncbi:MAG: metalloregulator ArsR/SmtB family transcription factor [Candidatus Diapherotrites archaeon]|nr:metalloregulator ArsR/SmtB family transcription factor [Candidatus Diapherotrites archaeon]
MDLFRALGNQNRRNILKFLLQKEFHVSGLARELNISVPVTLKHVNVLESVGLVERERIGNTHVLKIRKDALEKLKGVWDLFEKPLVLKVKKGSTILEALKKIEGVTFSKTGNGIVYIDVVDGKKGMYVYDVNGVIPLEYADQFRLKENCTVEIKRLVPVVGKKVSIRVE